jgi:hypothetical protein
MTHKEHSIQERNIPYNKEMICTDTKGGRGGMRWKVPNPGNIKHANGADW